MHNGLFYYWEIKSYFCHTNFLNNAEYFKQSTAYAAIAGKKTGSLRFKS